MHNYYTCVSLHDSDHEGVVRIFVALSCELRGYLHYLHYLHQVATTLLVAGSTLAFWIPWQTSFASTSSYLSVVQSARRLANGSFQLTHMSRDDHAVELIEPWRPRRRQNIITALTTLPQGWHQCGQNLRGPFLRATLPDCALERWPTTRRQKGS